MNKADAQKQLENALVTTYLANLAFLAEYDKELYLKIEELSKMIDEGIYKEKYSLEFMEESGDFDIYDLINEKYLYNKKSKKINSDLISSIEFNDKNSIKSLENALYRKYDYDITDEEVMTMRRSLQDITKSAYLLRYDVGDYLDILDSKKEKKFKKIEKFIFFGTLLGRHIHKIAEKIDASEYFVCERNLEIFRLSLFVNDYQILAKNNGVIFSIMDDEKDLKTKVHRFLEFKPFSNYLIKLSSTGVNVKEYIDAFLSSLVFRKPTTFDYNRMLYTVLRNITEKMNNYPFLDFDYKKDYDFFKGKPVLLVCAGPSFHEELDWIKENKDKFFIASLGATYKTLIDNGIKVDLMITLDANYEVLESHQFSQESCDLLEDTIVFASSMTDHRILSRMKKENIYIFEVLQSLFKDKTIFASSSVGEKSVDLLLSMDVKELYLVGLDLALNQKTGKSHSSNTDSIIKSFEMGEDSLNDRAVFGLNKGIISEKGNLEDKVYTTSLYKGSIECLNKIVLANKEEKQINIYNLSRHGAYFKETTPIESQDIKIKDLDKKLLTKEFKEFVRANTKSKLDKEDIEKIEIEIDYLENSVLDEYKEFKEKTHETYDDFYSTLSSIINKVATKNDKLTLLPFVFKSFLGITLSYFNYSFNSKKIKNEKQKVKRMKDVFTKQIDFILEDYINYLKKLI